MLALLPVPGHQGLFRTVGYGGDSGSITDIAQAALVLIVGSNTGESHPVLATRVKRAQKLHGQKVIVADLRGTKWHDVPTFLPPAAEHGSGMAFRDEPLHFDEGWPSGNFSING